MLNGVILYFTGFSRQLPSENKRKNSSENLLLENHAESDLLAFYESVKEGYLRAVKKNGCLIKKYFCIADYKIQLNFCGSAILPKITPAISHLEIDETSKLFPEAQIYLAFIFDKLGDKDTSKRIINNAIKIRKEDLNLYRFLASLYEEENKFIEGINVLNQALSVKHDDEDTLFYLGVLYDKASMFNESVKAMESVLKINEHNADALNFIGYIYAERGIYLDKAEKLIKKALKIKPGDAYITDSLGWVYFKKGEYKKALEELIKAFKLLSTDPVVTEHLGDVYLMNSKPDKAEEMYKKALELDPSKVEIKNKLEKLRLDN